MFRELTEVPPGVIGFELSGTIHADDYRSVLVPALERAAAAGEVRIVLVIQEFRGMTGTAGLGGPQGRLRPLREVEAHRARDGRPVGLAPHRVVRLVDARRDARLLDGRA